MVGVQSVSFEQGLPHLLAGRAVGFLVGILKCLIRVQPLVEAGDLGRGVSLGACHILAHYSSLELAEPPFIGGDILENKIPTRV